jgi:hypothetical protein
MSWKSVVPSLESGGPVASTARLAMMGAVSFDRSTQAAVITIIVVADYVIGDGTRAVILGDESDIDLFDLSTRRRCGALNRVSSLAFRIASPLYLIEVARASGRYLAYRVFRKK